MLIPAFEGRGRDGVERDSLGRGVDGKSVAAVVASDAQVRRELEARSIYLQTAYRDPKAATTRLNELVARDGATSAARRLSTEPGLLGELRGREGLFAGGKARAERQAATRAAAAIGPNVTRLSEAEAQAAQGYRASVAAQLKADGAAIPKLSDRAVAALGIVAAAKTDQARAEAYRTLTADAGMKREVDTFRQIRRGALRRGGRPRHRAGRRPPARRSPTLPSRRRSNPRWTPRRSSTPRPAAASAWSSAPPRPSACRRARRRARG